MAYPHGRDKDFADCFGPTWGRFKRPATGNHDHATKEARGYADYFGSRGGAFDRYYYSYDLGDWHVAVLDSDCWRVGGCGPGDPQAVKQIDPITVDVQRRLGRLGHGPLVAAGNRRRKCRSGHRPMRLERRSR